MFGLACKQFEVLQAVVGPITVRVMHDLFRTEGPPDAGGHRKTMFWHIADRIRHRMCRRDADENITLLVNDPATAPLGVQAARAADLRSRFGAVRPSTLSFSFLLACLIRNDSHGMAVNEPNRLIADVPVAPYCLARDGCPSAAAAHAVTAWVRAGLHGCILRSLKDGVFISIPGCANG